MKEFDVYMNYTRSLSVVIEAETEVEAYEIAEEQLSNGELEDYFKESNVDIEVTEHIV